MKMIKTSEEEKENYTINLINRLKICKNGINHSVFRERFNSIKTHFLTEDDIILDDCYEWAPIIDHVTLIFSEILKTKPILPEHLCESFKMFYNKTFELTTYFAKCKQDYLIILKLTKLADVLYDFCIAFGSSNFQSKKVYFNIILVL